MSTAHINQFGWQDRWQAFRHHRLGYWSFWFLVVFLTVSLLAELVSNDRPIVVYYQGNWYVPLINDYPETTFGGDFATPTDYLDPFIQSQLQKKGNFALYPINRYGPETLNYYAKSPNPAAPSTDNWLGTDDRGRDIVARILYGFRISFIFAVVLTVIATVVGMFVGAIQGYFGGRTDLWIGRLIEVWGSMPELYLLIILASIFERSFILLIILLSMFAWLGTANYVRAEFLRNRQLDYVKAAKALGVPTWRIMCQHILPNSLTAVMTLLPFALSGSIVTLTSLDFLGLGVPPSTPSLGELLLQGKSNMESWWIALSTFTLLAMTLLALTFVGDAIRQIMDPNKVYRF